MPENSNYLSHHGILEQKWGKRNGPPYPLGSGSSGNNRSRSEKREARKQKRAVKKFARDTKKYIKNRQQIEAIDRRRDTRYIDEGVNTGLKVAGFGMSSGTAAPRA